MVYAFDYILMLEKFEWPLSINNLGQKYADKNRSVVINYFNRYSVYYRYVRVIWLRIISDLRTYQFLKNTWDKQIFPSSRTGMQEG
jgi:hypothetical protein